MRQKRGRPKMTNLDWSWESPKPPSKSSNTPPLNAPEYPENPCPQDFPEIGKKFGPSAFTKEPFPLCLGISLDPNTNAEHHFHDRICLKFLSDLHHLLTEQGRVHDVARIVDSLKEQTNDNSGSISCETLKKQLGLATTTLTSACSSSSSPCMTLTVNPIPLCDNYCDNSS